MTASDAFTIGGVRVGPGERRRVEIPVARPYGPSRLSLPAVVVHGRQPGPRLFVSAAIHGDEINGVEIIRRLLVAPRLRRIRGVLIAIPVVNVYGFLQQTRYLPDRRDLNRAFPGSERGSLTGRLADVFMREVVSQATHGIDLHTAAVHRSNLPQIRACLEDATTRRLAEAFGVPVIVDANVRDGSLRQAVLERKIPMLLYEGGEALRFDEIAIRAGVRGILAVMCELGMLDAPRRPTTRVLPVEARTTSWIRADEGGILRVRKKLGAQVEKGDVLGVISDPLGGREDLVRATITGIVIGRTELPLVNEGDALFHIASFDHRQHADREIQRFEAELDVEAAPSPSGEPPVL